jgi:hypothetical protein
LPPAPESEFRGFLFNQPESPAQRKETSMPLKLAASVCKKLPDEQQYSSKSYLASVELELPSDLSPEQLNAEIHKTYAQLERAVDEQIAGKAPSAAGQERRPEQKRVEAPEGKASKRQLKYLLDLSLARNNKTLDQLNADIEKRFGVSVFELGRKECSHLIDELMAA